MSSFVNCCVGVFTKAFTQNLGAERGGFAEGGERPKKPPFGGPRKPPSLISPCRDYATGTDQEVGLEPADILYWCWGGKWGGAWQLMRGSQTEVATGKQFGKAEGDTITQLMAEGEPEMKMAIKTATTTTVATKEDCFLTSGVAGVESIRKWQPVCRRALRRSVGLFMWNYWELALNRVLKYWFLCKSNGVYGGLSSAKYTENPQPLLSYSCRGKYSDTCHFLCGMWRRLGPKTLYRAAPRLIPHTAPCTLQYTQDHIAIWEAYSSVCPLSFW